MQIADKPIWLSRANHVHNSCYFIDEVVFHGWFVFEHFHAASHTFWVYWIHHSYKSVFSIFCFVGSSYFCYCHCVCCVSHLFSFPLLFCFAIDLTFGNGCQKEDTPNRLTIRASGRMNERTFECSEWKELNNNECNGKKKLLCLFQSSLPRAVECICLRNLKS